MTRYYLLLLLILSWMATPVVIQAQISRNDTSAQIGNPDNISQEQIILSGKIIAVATGDYLQGASIGPIGFGSGIKSDELGRYKFALPPGTFRFMVTHPEMAPLSFQLEIYRSGNLNIRMDYPSKELEEVVMEAYSREEKVNEVISGVERVSIEDLKLQPALMGEIDVVNSLQNLAGVSQVGEGAAGYKIYWRDTTSPTWDYSRTVGNVTSATLDGIVIDNFFFGVAAIGANGHESMVVFPNKIVR